MVINVRNINFMQFYGYIPLINLHAVVFSITSMAQTTMVLLMALPAYSTSYFSSLSGV